ncbi:MAG TPA: MoaD/ThiS family protein [Longimicrobiaceae bacterium]|nr:MoaD/ThiS family protein [Longimicrobiaceae bacterium]
MTKVRVALPVHLRTLARVDGDVEVPVGGDPTVDELLDALESAYPTLAGTIREHGSGKRRAYMRFFACGRDLSQLDQSTQLPEEVVSGAETFYVIGAIAGG